MAALHRFQRQRDGRLHLGAADIAILEHLAQHVIAAADRAVIVAHGVEIRRRLRQRGQVGRLFQRQILEIGVEIGLGGGSHTIGILSEENLVEIQLKDTLLAQGLLDPRGQDDLAHLAFDGARPVEQEILHHLLRDGRGPPHIPPPALNRLVKGRRDGARVIAAMLVEIAVLRADKGMGDQVGNILGRHEQAPLGGEFVHDQPLARIDAADRGGRVGGQRLGRGQIARIHEQDAAHRDGDRDHAQRHRRKDRAEKTKDESDHEPPPVPVAQPIAVRAPPGKSHAQLSARQSMLRKSGNRFCAPGTCAIKR